MQTRVILFASAKSDLIGAGRRRCTRDLDAR